MAAKVLIVKVTRKHIREGKPRQSWNCPIALALISSHHQEDDIGAGPHFVWIGDKSYRHSKASREFIKDFDGGRPVKPTTFRLKVRQ